MDDTCEGALAASLPDFQQAAEFIKVMFPTASNAALTATPAVAAPTEFMFPTNSMIADPAATFADTTRESKTSAELVSMLFHVLQQSATTLQFESGGADFTVKWPHVPLDHVAAFASMVIRLAKYATTAESIGDMFSTLSLCVAKDHALVMERRDIFATEEMRDQLFIPLAQHATSERAVDWLFAVMGDLVAPGAGALRRRMIFATPAVSGQIFATLAQFATSTDANKALFTALHCLTCKSGPDSDVAQRRDTFATVAIRDDVFILAAKMKIPDTAENLLTALADITSGDDANAAKRRQLFATDAMVKHVFLTVARSMQSQPKVVQQYFQAIFNLTERCDGESDSEVGRRRDLFFAARVDVIIKASTAVASPASVMWLHRALLNICSGGDANASRRRELLAFDDDFEFNAGYLDRLFKFPAANATTAASVEAFFNAVACLMTLTALDHPSVQVEDRDPSTRRRRQVHKYFGTNSELIYVAVGKKASTLKSVEAMLTALSNIAKSEWVGYIPDSTARQLIVSKAKHMTSPLAIQLVFSLLKELTFDAVSQHVFTTVEMRDELFLALSDRVTTNEIVLALFTALQSLTDSRNMSGGRRRCELFTTSAVRDKLFRRLTQYATTQKCALSIARALCNLVTVVDVPWPIFSTGPDIDTAAAAYISQNLYADDVSCTLCDLFGTAEVMDDVFVSINKLLDPVDFEWFFTTLIVPIFGNKQELFASATMRDTFVLPLARHFELQFSSTDRKECPYPPLLTTLRDVLRGDDVGAARRREIFATPEVWNSVFVSCARYIEKPSHAVLWCETLKVIGDGDDAGAANRRRLFDIANAPGEFLAKLAEWSTSLHASALLALLMERFAWQTTTQQHNPSIQQQQQQQQQQQH